MSKKSAMSDYIKSTYLCSDIKKPAKIKPVTSNINVQYAMASTQVIQGGSMSNAQRYMEEQNVYVEASNVGKILSQKITHNNNTTSNNNNIIDFINNFINNYPNMNYSLDIVYDNINFNFSDHIKY